MTLTVYWDGQFWVGVVEERTEGRLRACRHRFGSEPHDAEVLAFVRGPMADLLERTTKTVAFDAKEPKRVNPKRLARQAAAEMKMRGASAFAQEAIKLELEHRQETSKRTTRRMREEAEERKREIARRKAKEKHRGR
ncbi:YjdF family protein [Paenibacillus flagellatus]|uniref:DUF2992 domain-containing protein n=1 Tax=Paenibacillus flagellatus TaxID=2211139 RepID=A0A2V5KW75_9BACL|nr:YjdF family protein [Paenibacillus flagellatus]PYI56517.1 DUF2992 domain-containing protein [Paenibacillus flagellatus]